MFNSLLKISIIAALLTSMSCGNQDNNTNKPSQLDKDRAFLNTLGDATIDSLKGDDKIKAEEALKRVIAAVDYKKLVENDFLAVDWVPRQGIHYFLAGSPDVSVNKCQSIRGLVQKNIDKIDGPALQQDVSAAIVKQLGTIKPKVIISSIEKRMKRYGLLSKIACGSSDEYINAELDKIKEEAVLSPDETMESNKILAGINTNSSFNAFYKSVYNN